MARGLELCAVERDPAGCWITLQHRLWLRRVVHRQEDRWFDSRQSTCRCVLRRDTKPFLMVAPLVCERLAPPDWPSACGRLRERGRLGHVA